MKLNEKAFGLAAGIVAAAHVLLGYLGLGMGMGMMGGMNQGMMLGGGVVGIVTSFIVGLIGGYAFAWLYNALHKG